MNTPTELFIWFAENEGRQQRGEHYIRAWTGDAAQVPTLQEQIGREPLRYSAALAPSDAAGAPVAWLLRAKNGMIRAAYTTPRTEVDYEIAAIDGDTITPLYAAPVAPAAPTADAATRLRRALYQIAHWPDGGNAYGQEKIKRFAIGILDGEPPTVAADAAAPSDETLPGTYTNADDLIAALKQPGERAAPLNGIPATLQHDEGAIARCSYCGRYSLDPKTLSDRQPKCDCGERHGWSGSFSKPGHDAKWSGAAPQGAKQ